MFDYRDDVAADHRRAYDLYLARDRVLFDDDPEQFERAGGTAWAWRYLPAVAANYQVRLERGAARDKDLFRLADVLTGLGEFARARPLFDNPASELEVSSVYWLRLAENLTGLGCLREARDAARRAVTEFKGGKGARRLLEGLEGLLTLQDQLDAKLCWRGAADFVTGGLALGADASVASVILRLVNNAPRPASDDIDALCTIAAAAVRLAPHCADALIHVVHRMAPNTEAGAALQIEHDLRRGRTAQARALAKTAASQAVSRDLLYHGALALEASGDREPAIRALGRLASKFDRDHDIRSALARFVGEDVLARTKPTFAPAAPGARPRVINLIPFNNEITMLETRLREMADWVDLFVIVEAAQTFMGGPKRCGFDEIKNQYAEYGEKIRHVKIDAFPEYVDTAWARDCWQRDMAIAAIDGWWRPDDLVLLTDSDEIVQRDAVADFEIGQIALKMKTYRYFFNYEAQPGNPKNDGHTGVICTADQLGTYGSSYIRFSLSRASKSWNFIPRAGWHFTSMGDAETLVRKFSSYAHQERNKTKLKDTGRMGALLEGIRAGRFEEGWARCEIDESFPAVIRERRDELGDLVLTAVR